MILKPKLSMLGRTDMEKIHEATLKILADTGVAFQSEAALDYFRQHGFTIENETVFFKPNQVQTALEQCPEQFTFSARNPENTLIIGDKNPSIQPASGCVYIMAGITAPLDLMGTALMQNAEMLACTVLIQLINPGLPVVYSPASVVGNMKRASFCTGSPESMLINLINLHLSREFYHIPTRSLTGATDAKIPDFQAGAESMQNLMLSMLGGSEIINEALGTLESYMTLSFEKYLLDEENIRRLLRIQNGLSLTNVDRNLNLINEIGIKGDYLTHASTFNKFRELWQPTLSNWDSYDQWTQNENNDLMILAQKRVKALINEAPETLLSPSLDQELIQYMNNAGAFS